MPSSIFRGIFHKIILISAIIITGNSPASAVWMDSTCYRTGDSYANLGWAYVPSIDFTNWLNTSAVGANIKIASVDFGSDTYNGNVANGAVCSVSFQGSGNPFTRRNTTAIITATAGDAGYYQITGFTGVQFKVVLSYSNEAPLNINTGSLGTASNNQTATFPGSTFPSSNLGACTIYGSGTSSAMTACTWYGKHGQNSTYSAEFRQKKWSYSLIAYKTNANPTIGQFPTAANALPVIKVNGAFTDTTYSTTPPLYCIGCSASTGTPPTVAVPASCSISGGPKQEINMSPATVNWNHFTQTVSAVKVNETWTPFFIRFVCANSSLKTATLKFKDATAGALITEPAGKLLNSNGGNVGVQVFYKTAANATCSGTPTLANGLALPLNNTTQVNIPGATATMQPTQYFCARYYTSATTAAALTPGAVASTMAYTFTYD